MIMFGFLSDWHLAAVWMGGMSPRALECDIFLVAVGNLPKAGGVQPENTGLN